ncbi:MAG: hypothetical protein AABX75_03100 [Nanoarchaeota archaeon]
MKKYAVLAIAVVLVVLLAAASVDAFQFKFFKPTVKIAKVTPTSTAKAPAQNFAPSSYGFCDTSSDCVQLGCSARLCGSVLDPPPSQGSDCAVPPGDGSHMACGCLNHQCQWAKAWSWYGLNQGQGQGTSQNSGNGNGQSSQGQQGQGSTEAQGQNQGEGGSFQCLNLPEEKKCIDGEGVHQYCTGADSCYTRRGYNCGAGENGIQKCIADAVAAMCIPSC